MVKRPRVRTKASRLEVVLGWGCGPFQSILREHLLNPSEDTEILCEQLLLLMPKQFSKQIEGEVANASEWRKAQSQMEGQVSFLTAQQAVWPERGRDQHLHQTAGASRPGVLSNKHQSE